MKGRTVMIRLGVNVDHVATLREARKTVEPEPVYAALIAEEAGADSIVVHLREDRRHIKERDVRTIREVLKIPLNLEMATADDIVGIALDIQPRQATLVPEKREEVTTEGGLDIENTAARLRDVIKSLKDKNIMVSLFIDPESAAVEMSRDLGADAIELHTGRFAESYMKGEEEFLKELEAAARLSSEIGLLTFAGHGLTYQNVHRVAAIPQIEELNIGHSIVSRAVTVGIGQAVAEMIEAIERGILMREELR
jgi:pyridoxine 5-phosphate synthase